jgi:hypothetical protein
MSETTRLQQAERLLAVLQTVQTHVTAFPVAVPVAVDVRTYHSERAADVMLDGDAVADVAAALLSWASILTDTTATLWRSTARTTVHLSVSGRTTLGIAFRVHSAVPYAADVFGDIPPGDTRPLTLDQLQAWAASAEVQS